MSFYDDLLERTTADRQFLISAPIIQRTLNGDITRELYVAFLTQAYHHVRHTVPLLMSVGAQLPDRLLWLQPALAHYIEEELGHERWILNDIEAAGGDPAITMHTPPDAATDALIAFAYDTVRRRNPIGFFGMALVLEGTSVALALRAADRIQTTLHLPPRACSYLRSHGSLDQEHTQDLANILNRLDHDDDRQSVLQTARAVYWLYGSIFYGLDQRRESMTDQATALRRIA